MFLKSSYFMVERIRTLHISQVLHAKFQEGYATF